MHKLYSSKKERHEMIMDLSLIHIEMCIRDSYRANPCEKTEKFLSRHLADAKRVPLYQYLYKLVIKASKRCV